MDIETLRAFFGWCTIINSGMLAVAFLICTFAGGIVYSIHSRWFPMPRETFTVTIYRLLGISKLVVVFGNLTPYLVLLIIG